MIEMPKAVKYMEREVNLGGCSIMKKRMWKKAKAICIIHKTNLKNSNEVVNMLSW
jgi:hypothetical protein